MKKYNSDRWNMTWLKSKPVNIIWKVLSSKGAKVYFVGGCVRDSVQARKIKDIDIATDALPSEVIELAKLANLKVIKTGLEHGSVAIIVQNERFDITTFRSDIVTDGRHSTVRFSLNILDDAMRRDFTMNALYMTIDGEILDPISGFEDLVSGRVRFIGEPEKRIREDYLRVLRYFRFLTIYGEKAESLDHSTVDACSNAIFGLKTLSNDRIWEELQKILLADNPNLSLKLMYSSGVLEAILPFAKLENLHRFLILEKKFKIKFKEINRLAVLNPSQVRFWAKRFPFKREQRRWLDTLLVNLNDSSSLRVRSYKYGADLTISAYAIFKSHLSKTLDSKDLAEINAGSSQSFPINNSDLLEYYSQSKALGDEFKRLKDLWFSSNLELDRHNLLTELKKKAEAKDIG